MDIVQKIQNILLKPKETFVTLKAEKQDLMSLLTGYVLLLAALPAIGSALGMIRFPSWAIRMAIVGYVTALAVYFAGAFLLQVLSKNFGGNGDLAQAAKTIAYSMTAGWVAGIATFIPVLGMLISLAGGIYSLYLPALSGPSGLHGRSPGQGGRPGSYLRGRPDHRRVRHHLPALEHLRRRLLHLSSGQVLRCS